MKTANYLQCLDQDVFEQTTEAAFGGLPADVRPYFMGHLPRFEAQLDMFRKHLTDDHIDRVYDFGTGLPFVSYYFNLTQGAEVLYGMPPEGEHQINDRVRYISVNLCNNQPELEPADLVICTECLEHLPCPIPPVVDYLTGLVKPQKYLLLSFPFGTIRLGDLDHDFGDHDTVSSGHKREFSQESAEDLLGLIGWPIVDDALTFTKAYGGNIWNVLLQNKGANHDHE